MSLISLLDGGYFVDYHGIDVLHEQYSATLDIPKCNKDLIKHLESEGFEVIHEESTIYTVKYEE